MSTKVESEIEELKNSINQIRDQKKDTNLKKYAKDVSALETKQFRPTRNLTGHQDKIFALQTAVDKDIVVSTGQDGKMIVWDALLGKKIYEIALNCNWPLTCGLSPSGQVYASGGLDNICTVYRVSGSNNNNNNNNSNNRNNNSGKVITKTLGTHEAYLSCCRFIGSDSKILTSSGDSSCVLWDIEKGVKEAEFLGHHADVTSLCLASNDTFISGSCDSTAKLWDLRSGRCEHTYPSRGEGEINSVALFPSGTAFGTSSDDGACRLFDIRTEQQVAFFKLKDKAPSSATSLCFSHSGRFLFVGYENSGVGVWDTLRAEPLALMNHHQRRVTCLGMLPSGLALCSGSWDASLKIWA